MLSLPCVLNWSVSWFARESFDLNIFKLPHHHWLNNIGQTETTLHLQWDTASAGIQVCVSCSATFCPKWAGIKMATAHDACVLISCSCPTVGLNTVTRFNDLWESGMLGYVSEMALQTWSAFVWHRCYCRPDLDVCLKFCRRVKCI